MPKRVTSAGGLDEHQREFIKLLQANARAYRAHEVFRDFCELAALSISNSVDRAQFEEREARYLQIVKRYEPEQAARFPQMLAAVTESLEAGFHDCLGALFMALELGDYWHGQFFTPYHVASAMSRMTLNDAGSMIEQHGFIRVNEPACGAGCMVIAAAEAMRDEGHNYQRVMHVVAQDIEQTAVHMAYIQLSLLYVPGIVVHGNSLARTEWGRWYTPAHVLGGWGARLRRRAEAEAAAAPPPPPAPEPPPITGPAPAAAESQMHLF